MPGSVWNQPPFHMSTTADPTSETKWVCLPWDYGQCPKYRSRRTVWQMYTDISEKPAASVFSLKMEAVGSPEAVAPTKLHGVAFYKTAVFTVFAVSSTALTFLPFLRRKMHAPLIDTYLPNYMAADSTVHLHTSNLTFWKSWWVLKNLPSSGSNRIVTMPLTSITWFHEPSFLHLHWGFALSQFTYLINIAN
jgi:hypothetical protein